MRLIKRDYCQFTGITEEFWYTDPVFKDGPGKITIRRLQDVEHKLAENKIEFNSHQGKKPKYTCSDGLHKVASIPLMLLEKWLKEDGFDWYNSSDAERRAKLNDRDNQKLLTRPGKL
jgi:hypothetical protein